MAAHALALLVLVAACAARRLSDTGAALDDSINAYQNILQPVNSQPFRAFAVAATLTNPATLEPFVLVFGGQAATSGPLGDTWLLNLTTQTLRELKQPSPPPPRFAAGFAVLGDGCSLFMTGGSAGCGAACIAHCSAQSQATTRWRPS